MSTKAKSYPPKRSPIYQLPSRRKLAELLRIDMKQLRRLSGDLHLYSHFPVAKKDGSPRMVDNPRDELKRVQRRIAKFLARILPPDILFCPVKGRSYIDNARQHRGHRIIHSLDVQKYFPSTRSQRVYWFFHSVMLCPPDVAAVLTKIACCEGHLPTGSPLSPILAYYAHVDIWEKVARIAKANGCAVSIWIDDITVSGTKVPKAVMWDIKQAIHGGGLRYHKEKRAVDRRAEVTGVVILRDGQLVVPNRQRRKLRNLKREKDRERRPEANKSLMGRLAGMNGQVAQIAAGNLKE
jgi:Reverse transcriptase (RNA-dependent DNA polymerase)